MTNGKTGDERSLVRVERSCVKVQILLHFTNLGQTMKKVECKVCGDYGVVATNPRAKCRHRDCPEHCKAWEKLHRLLGGSRKMRRYNLDVK